MNLRIKKVRKHLDLTQQAFAERIGMKQNSIALIESGKRNISDQAILSICREFDICEEWLRTGEGEMFKPKPSDILDQLAYKYRFSNMDYAIVEKYVSLKPEKRNEILRNVFDFLHEVEAALSDLDPYSQAYSGDNPPMPMDSFIESIKTMREGNAATSKTVEELKMEYIKNRSNSARKTMSFASNSTGESMKKKNA